MKRKKNQPRFLEAFSPTIMESTVPKRFVDIVNEVGDTILSDDVKSAKWDWSHKLVGKVSKEVQIPISNSDDREFLFRIMRQGCLDYLKYIISKNSKRVEKFSSNLLNSLSRYSSFVLNFSFLRDKSLSKN